MNIESFNEALRLSENADVSTWGESVLHAPSIATMLEMHRQLRSRLMDERGEWFAGHRLHKLLMGQERILSAHMPAPFVTELANVRHIPVLDDPKSPHALTLYDHTGEFEVSLAGLFESRTRSALGESLPDKRVLKENVWERVVRIKGDILKGDMPKLIFVEDPPDSEEPFAALHPDRYKRLQTFSWET